MKKLLFDRAIFTEPYGSGKPVNYRGYLVPEYFNANFYFYDNDGREVTPANAKSFKTWTLELLIRVTKAETLVTSWQLPKPSTLITMTQLKPIT
jgi:hypothetical protein